MNKSQQGYTPVQWIKKEVNVIPKNHEHYPEIAMNFIDEALRLEHEHKLLQEAELRLEIDKEYIDEINRLKGEIVRLKKNNVVSIKPHKKYVFETILSQYNGNADNLIKECELIANWLIKK